MKSNAAWRLTLSNGKPYSSRCHQPNYNRHFIFLLRRGESSSTLVTQVTMLKGVSGLLGALGGDKVVDILHGPKVTIDVKAGGNALVVTNRRADIKVEAGDDATVCSSNDLRNVVEMQTNLTRAANHAALTGNSNQRAITDG